MKNKRILMGILAGTLVFGLVFVGCEQATNDNSSKEGDQMTKFEGIWKNTDSSTGNTAEYTFKNNRYTLTMKESGDTLVWQGIFTFDDTKITFTPTSAPSLVPDLSPSVRYYQISDDNTMLWIADSSSISTTNENACIKQN
jgi:hypothetical protein